MSLNQLETINQTIENETITESYLQELIKKNKKSTLLFSNCYFPNIKPFSFRNVIKDSILIHFDSCVIENEVYDYFHDNSSHFTWNNTKEARGVACENHFHDYDKMEALLYKGDIFSVVHIGDCLLVRNCVTPKNDLDGYKFDLKLVDIMLERNKAFIKKYQLTKNDHAITYYEFNIGKTTIVLNKDHYSEKDKTDVEFYNQNEYLGMTYVDSDIESIPTKETTLSSAKENDLPVLFVGRFKVKFHNKKTDFTNRTVFFDANEYNTNINLNGKNINLEFKNIKSLNPMSRFNMFGLNIDCENAVIDFKHVTGMIKGYLSGDSIIQGDNNILFHHADFRNVHNAKKTFQNCKMNFGNAYVFFNKKDKKYIKTIKDNLGIDENNELYFSDLKGNLKKNHELNKIDMELFNLTFRETFQYDHKDQFYCHINKEKNSIILYSEEKDRFLTFLNEQKVKMVREFPLNEIEHCLF